MGRAVKLKLVKPRVNKDAIAAVRELLARLKSGEACALAVVEVQRGGAVASEYFASEGQYHYLHSGAWRLATMLADVEDEEE